MRDYTTIPALLCQYAILNQKVNELKLYIYLKLNSDGFVSIDTKNANKWSKELGLSSKTIKKCLEWLQSQKWITVNSKRNSLKICGYAKLKNLLDIDRTINAIFEPTSVTDYKNFRAFCCGAVITHYLGKKKYFDKKQSAVKNGTSNLNRLCKNGFYPMANNYLAKCLGVSLSTAFRIKNEAEKEGYIETKASFDTLEDCVGNKLPSKSYDVIRTIYAQDGLDCIIRKGKRNLLIVVPDRIKSNIVIKKRIKHN